MNLYNLEEAKRSQNNYLKTPKKSHREMKMKTPRKSPKNMQMDIDDGANSEEESDSEMIVLDSQVPLDYQSQ